jgi:hypothetical protein
MTFGVPTSPLRVCFFGPIVVSDKLGMSRAEKHQGATMEMLGKPGELVPQVDPADIKAMLNVGQEVARSHFGQNVPIGKNVFAQYCSKGADIEAVWYRTTYLGIMVARYGPFGIDPWIKEGQPDEMLIRTMAEIPMKWTEVGVPRQGVPFDWEDLVRRLNSLSSD